MIKGWLSYPIGSDGQDIGDEVQVDIEGDPAEVDEFERVALVSELVAIHIAGAYTGVTMYVEYADGTTVDVHDDITDAAAAAQPPVLITIRPTGLFRGRCRHKQDGEWNDPPIGMRLDGDLVAVDSYS